MKQEIPTSVVVVVLAVLVLIIGFFLYRTWVGGTQGDGRPGEVQAAPPVPGGGAPPNARIISPSSGR